MRPPSHIRWAKSALALICAWLAAQAAEGPRFFACSFSIPERGEVTGYVLVLGSNRFSFIPPAGWQVKYDANQGAVRLTAPDYAASISVCILPADPQSPAEAWAEALRKKVAKRFPGASITSEQPSYLGDLEGLAFDLEWTAGPQAKVASRVCWFPLSGALVELRLTTAAPKLKEQSAPFNVLLASFEVEAGGQSQESPALAPK